VNTSGKDKHGTEQFAACILTTGYFKSVVYTSSIKHENVRENRKIDVLRRDSKDISDKIYVIIRICECELESARKRFNIRAKYEVLDLKVWIDNI
jgi:hypothetical protein